MELTPKQTRQLYEALLDAFPRLSDLSMLTDFELGVNLHAVVPTGNLSQAVFELISWSKAHGRLNELIAGAVRRNEGNPQLKRFAEEVGWTVPATATSTTETAETPRRDSAPNATASTSTDDAKGDTLAKTRVFVSYSHRDKKWLDLLQTHLKPLIRNKAGAISVWDDTSIAPGEKWRDAISGALSQANVAVLLVSPDFLASDFITNNELPQLLHGAEQKGLTVIWIPIRPSAYKSSPIGEYQAAYPPARALSGLSVAERDAALVEIAEKIEAVALRS